jgi:hypothetical protein
MGINLPQVLDPIVIQVILDIIKKAYVHQLLADEKDELE